MTNHNDTDEVTNLKLTWSTDEELDEVMEGLEERLRNLQDIKRAQKQVLKESMSPVYKFTLSVDNQKFDKIWDESVVLYRLDGRVVNKDELQTVGWSDHDISEGSHSYLYNKATGRLIMGHGGGRLWLTEPGWAFSGGFNVKEAIEEEFESVKGVLELFIHNNPNGGDITDIILTHRNNIDNLRKGNR